MAVRICGMRCEGHPAIHRPLNPRRARFNQISGGPRGTTVCPSALLMFECICLGCSTNVQTSISFIHALFSISLTLARNFGSGSRIRRRRGRASRGSTSLIVGGNVKLECGFEWREDVEDVVLFGGAPSLEGLVCVEATEVLKGALAHAC